MSLERSWHSYFFLFISGFLILRDCNKRTDYHQSGCNNTSDCSERGKIAGWQGIRKKKKTQLHLDNWHWKINVAKLQISCWLCMHKLKSWNNLTNKNHNTGNRTQCALYIYIYNDWQINLTDDGGLPPALTHKKSEAAAATICRLGQLE